MNGFICHVCKRVAVLCARPFFFTVYGCVEVRMFARLVVIQMMVKMLRLIERNNISTNFYNVYVAYFRFFAMFVAVEITNWPYVRAELE